MIHSYKYCKDKIGDVGWVAEVRGGLVKVDGFKGGALGQGVAFEDGTKGMIESVVKGKTQIMVFSNEPLKIGLKVARTGRPLRVSVGEGLLGHTVSSLGYLMDKGKEPSRDTELEIMDVVAWGIDKRRQIKKQLVTGLMVCDMVLPLGEGQRELVIGDRKSGKTDFLLKVLLSQASMGKVCIYGLIGKRQAEIIRIEAFLDKHKIRDRVILVASPAGSSSGEIYLTPFTVMAMAEHWRDLGQDSLVILDDMTIHAQYAREIALLANQFPGRESYPGGVFYTHAKLLERAGNFVVGGNKEVSITALPVAETQGGDLTGYIQTNLMSMTDGHLFFDEGLFLQGIRPAINVFLSVTRVGKQTQSRLVRELGGKMMKILKQRQDLERYLRFGAEITDNVKNALTKGDRLKQLVHQQAEGLYPVELGVFLIGLVLVDRWDGLDAADWLKRYQTDKVFKNNVDKMVNKSKGLDQLLKKTEKHETA